MTILEKIKESGGFLDCGAINSMPLGYFMDGTIATSEQYYEARKLLSERKLKITGQRTNEEFKPYLTNEIIKGDILKVK